MPDLPLSPREDALLSLLRAPARLGAVLRLFEVPARAVRGGQRGPGGRLLVPCAAPGPPWLLLGEAVDGEAARRGLARAWLEAARRESSAGWLVLLTDRADLGHRLRGGAWCDGGGLSLRPYVVDLSRLRPALLDEGDPLLAPLWVWAAAGLPACDRRYVVARALALCRRLPKEAADEQLALLRALVEDQRSQGQGCR